ncbi:hypothetical protein N9L68_08245 [bacterium]|nr:hypothetical protein [bacterium]
MGALDRKGYDGAWDNIDAHSCGAVHRRVRWFLLARRRSPAAHYWGACQEALADECPILTRQLWAWLVHRDAVVSGTGDPEGKRINRSRRLLKLLGNAVAPAQVRMALRTILRALPMRGEEWPWLARPLAALPTGSHAATGVLVAGRYRSGDWRCRERRGLTNDRTLGFDSAEARQGAARLPLLQGTQPRPLVATPRRLQVTASAPTRRTIGYFGTSVAFCTDFNRHVAPQGSTVEGDFICLTMGYQADWADDAERDTD